MMGVVSMMTRVTQKEMKVMNVNPPHVEVSKDIKPIILLPLVRSWLEYSRNVKKNSGRRVEEISHSHPP